jgi:hypothetical protein
MISFKPAILSVATLLAVSLTMPLKADTWNKKTVLTVKETIQLPHTVLQPGTYVFKLHNSLADRHIVQIFNADETQIIATILAIPNYRLKPTGKSVFGFWETPAGNPKAMRAWFYPGDNFGQEFAYPKMKSIEIATITHTAVPTILVEKEVVDIDVLTAAPIVVVTEKGEEAPLVLTAQNTTTVQNETVVVQDYTAVQAVAVQAAPEAADQRASAQADTLPRTASSLPLMGLAGLASLGAFGLLVCLPRRKSGLVCSRRS